MRTRILTAAAATLTTVAAVAVIAVPGTEAATTKTVRVVDNKFSPATLSVKRGTKVKFVWDAMTAHNVTLRGRPRSAKTFRSHTMQAGSYTSPAFKKKGTYKIVCTIHESFMTMTVKVK